MTAILLSIRLGLGFSWSWPRWYVDLFGWLAFLYIPIPSLSLPGFTTIYAPVAAFFIKSIIPVFAGFVAFRMWVVIDYTAPTTLGNKTSPKDKFGGVALKVLPIFF